MGHNPMGKLYDDKPYDGAGDWKFPLWFFGCVIVAVWAIITILMMLL
jgi:hypothetical protein